MTLFVLMMSKTDVVCVSEYMQKPPFARRGREPPLGACTAHHLGARSNNFKIKNDQEH